jgi:hypothetical protein
LTSSERRFLEEFEESFHVLVKTALSFVKIFLQTNLFARMVVGPYLPLSMPHVEKLADFLVLILPIFLPTSPGTIQSGLASEQRSTGAGDPAMQRRYR